MKKKILCCLVILFGFFLGSRLFINEKVYEEEKSVNIKNNNMLSMMLEQTAGVGDYELETRSSWPTDGYVFNETLSRCENGSKLFWNEESKAVVFSGNVSDKCYVYFDKYTPTLSEYVISQYTGTQGENNLYYHNSTLANGAGDNSYRYAGADGHDDYYTCTYDGNPVYSIRSVLDNNYSYPEDCSSVYSYTNGSYIEYFDKSVYDSITTVAWNSELSACLTSDGYKMMGDTKTDCVGTAYYFKSLLGYRLGNLNYVGIGTKTLYQKAEGVNNNYVCFGSDAGICPVDNLYRIIGVFDDKVKLIKATYANSELLGTDGDYVNYTVTAGKDEEEKGNYYRGDFLIVDNYDLVYFWNRVNYTASYEATGYYNDWSYSALNKINLNTNFINYLNNIDLKWANMIDTTEWKVGGVSTSKLSAMVIYTNEITSPSTQVISTYESKVGLMYVSDYAFAAAPSAWTTTLYNYGGNDTSGNKITEENWMYMGTNEWTMSRSTEDGDDSVKIDYSGTTVDYDNRNYSVNYDSRTVRPVFYLKSNIRVIDGGGTKDNPYRIKDGV